MNKMKKLSIGNCPVCNKKIWKFQKLPLIQFSQAGIVINLKPVPKELNDDGRHFWLLLDNGQRMMVAICKECYANMCEDMAAEIFSYITYTKLDYAVTKGWKMFDHIRTQTVWQWFGSEAAIEDYMANCSVQEEIEDDEA